MIPSRVLPCFSIVFCVSYVFCMQHNISMFAYYPAIGEFHTKALPKEAGPAMFFYAWLLNAFFCAAAISLLAALVPSRLVARLWPGWTWVIPAAVLVWAAYDMRIWFVR